MAHVATICILTYNDSLEYFNRCLTSVMHFTANTDIELRIGFNASPAAHAIVMQGLNDFTETEVAPGVTCRSGTYCGIPTKLYNAVENIWKDPMMRLMYYSPALDSEYTIWFDDDSYVEPGWWQALTEVFAKKVDYIGQEWVVPIYPGQVEMVKQMPWYRGKPIPTAIGRNGAPLLHFMTGGFTAVRTERIIEANWPNTDVVVDGKTLQQAGDDLVMGELAHQMGWSKQVHDKHIKVNVDMNGKHPAPTRTALKPPFGCKTDLVIH